MVKDSRPQENHSGELPRIPEDAFQTLVGGRSGPILALGQFIRQQARENGFLSRPLLGDLLTEATRLEEFLDAYGAKNNLRWHPFRGTIASLKSFSNVAYILLHIKHFMPAYHLLPIEMDFVSATQEAFGSICRIIATCNAGLADQAGNLGLPLPGLLPPGARFVEELPQGRLPFNRITHKVSSAEQTVVHLATAFLNLTEESKVLTVPHREAPLEYARCIPDPISEEKLGHLEQEFHSLQSLYDTYISGTNVESLDRNLPVLRGHVTVIYHLLEVATALAHYCERHLLNSSPTLAPTSSQPVDSAPLLSLLVNYSLNFARLYLAAARSLCHLMLKRYAKRGRIQAPVPKYRGFHVRPSTMIAKIVSHYGSEVRMRLGREAYNAGRTLDLFRANEKLNAEKRRRVAEAIARVLPEGAKQFQQDLAGEVRHLIHLLYEKKKLVIYEGALPLNRLKPLDGETGQQCVFRTVKHLLDIGKIDMEIDIKVTFFGDQRVLKDIRLLAEHGYGEDRFGNNIALPKALSYLRK